jgi:hypothetical protein
MPSLSGDPICPSTSSKAGGLKMAYTGIYRTAWVEITSNNGPADAAIPPLDTP